MDKETTAGEGRPWWTSSSRALSVAAWSFGLSTVTAGVCIVALRHSNGSGSAGSIMTGLAMAGTAVGLGSGVVASILIFAGSERAACRQGRRRWAQGLLISAWTSSAVLASVVTLSWGDRVGVGYVMGLAGVMTLIWAAALASAGWLLSDRATGARGFRWRGVLAGVLGLVACWGTFLAVVVVALSSLA